VDKRVYFRWIRLGLRGVFSPPLNRDTIRDRLAFPILKSARSSRVCGMARAIGLSDQLDYRNRSWGRGLAMPMNRWIWLIAPSRTGGSDGRKGNRSRGHGGQPARHIVKTP
jgi:hypothetical protein